MIDFCTTMDAVELDTEVDNIIQQIDVLFDTRPDEALGMNYGTNYSVYIHELNVGSMAIADRIKSDIQNNINLFGWHLDVEVKFLVGTLNDIILIAVQFSKETNVYSKVYKITEYQETYSPDDYVLTP